MTLFGRVTVGGVVLREAWQVQQSGTGLELTGEESTPPDERAVVEAVHHNVNGMPGLMLPVIFAEKAHLSGFYRVGSASSELFDRLGVVRARWSLALELVGTQRDVEFESRVPTIARSSEVAGTPEFWHAPPPGFSSYYTGATVPSGSTVRASAEGAVTVFRGIPNAVLPRWTVPAGDYLKGSARIVLDGIRRVGTETPPHESWELSNGLLRVAGDGGGITVAVLDVAAGPDLSAKGYRFTVGGNALTATPEVTVLRADPEECTLRLSWAQSPGRVTVDLSLRRGARFVTGVMKRHAATTLGVRRTTAETATVATGGLRATSADADGSRFVMGSTRTVTTATATAAMSKAGVAAFDFFLGHEVGATPAAGDAFADLFASYLGTASDRTRAVRR